ncbi:MAG: hypothetical protein KUG77_02310 [Nannocystaceae bacterium]|nr:hypothetical protein [Nannocystaceae bacterium]
MAPPSQVRCEAFDTSESSAASLNLAVGIDLLAWGTLVYVGGVANGDAWIARLAEDDGAIEFEDTFMSVDGGSRVNAFAADRDSNFVDAGEASGDVWIRPYNAEESIDWTRKFSL